MGQWSLSVELGLLLPGLTTEVNFNLTPTALDPPLNPGKLTADTSPCLTSTKRLIQRGKDGFTKDNTYLDNIFSPRGLHVLHLNVQSLLPKIHEIRRLAAQSKPDILSFSESWLDSYLNDSEIE